MLVKVVLIIDKRKEQSIKYKKLLESADTKVFLSTGIKDALFVLNNFEPDLILLSDSIQESLEDVIKKLRILSYNVRPVLITLSKSSHIQDRIDVLNAGADDFLSEPIEHEEFKARIVAHLRRHFENNINEKTQLFDSKISFKILKRTVNKMDDWAALLVDIDNFNFYKELYGDLAADKMLQTYTAIIVSSLDEHDYLGQLASDDFLIITNVHKAEKMANFLVYAFDTVVSRFYSENDAQRGYIIMSGDDKEGNKVALVSTSIGVIANEHRSYKNLRQAINSLIAVHKLAKLKTGSTYVFERPKLSAIDAVQMNEYNNKILIVEPDESLALLLLTTAQLKGYDAISINDYDEIFNVLNDFIPAVVILDAGNTDDLKGLKICHTIKNDEKFVKSNIILSTTLHNKQKVLSAGADLYLPKPYELSVIFNWVDKFIKEFNE